MVLTSHHILVPDCLRVGYIPPPSLYTSIGMSCGDLQKGYVWTATVAAIPG